MSMASYNIWSFVSDCFAKISEFIQVAGCVRASFLLITKGYIKSILAMLGICHVLFIHYYLVGI